MLLAWCWHNVKSLSVIIITETGNLPAVHLTLLIMNDHGRMSGISIRISSILLLRALQGE